MADRTDVLMDEPDQKIIDVFICKLRKKLMQASGGKDYIETIWGRGYVLRDPEPVRATTLLRAVGSPFEALAFSRDRPSAKTNIRSSGALIVLSMSAHIAPRTSGILSVP